MRILITGNGFDLAHGLPTTYNNFMHTIELIRNIDIDNLPTDYLSYFKINDTFNETNILENFKFDKEAIILIKKKSNNIWLNYFLKQFGIFSWIDFEKQIENVVQVLDSVLNKFNEFIFDKVDPHINAVNKKDSISSKSQIVDIVFDFGLVHNLEHSPKEFRFSRQYCQINGNNILSIKEREIFKNLKSELDDFSELFDLYLNTFVEPLSDLLKGKYEMMFNSVNTHFTFNYTNTFKKLYNCNIDTFFLHGRISTNDTPCNIVFGFNDVSVNMVKKENYIPFTKYYQKLAKKTDFKYLNYVDTNRTRNLEVYFWGHSLNKSDKIYIDEIIAMISQKKNSYLKIFYHSQDSYEEILINLMAIYDSERVVWLCKEGKISFIHSTEENIKQELNSYNEDNSWMGIDIV